jgi:hypothetical protein
VTIGSISEIIMSTRSGPLNFTNVPINLNFALSSALSSTATSKIVLSNFVHANIASAKRFSLGEVVVNGARAPAPSVPEPATWSLMMGGFGLIGSTMRRRTVQTSVVAI